MVRVTKRRTRARRTKPVYGELKTPHRALFASIVVIVAIIALAVLILGQPANTVGMEQTKEELSLIMAINDVENQNLAGQAKHGGIDACGLYTNLAERYNKLADLCAQKGIASDDLHYLTIFELYAKQAKKYDALRDKHCSSE